MFYVDENVSIVVQSVQPCHLYGDPDIYGIGVRLSFYIQWGATIIALILGVEDEVKLSRRGFNTVAIAVMINTFISAHNGSFAILELYIVFILVVMLSVCFVIPFGGPGNLRPSVEDFDQFIIFETNAFKADPIGIGILLIVDVAFLFSQPWLYFKILNQGHKAGCTPKVYFFFTTELYRQSWVTFLKFFAVFCVIVGLIFFALASYAIVYGLPKKGNSEVRDPEGGNQEDANRRTTFRKRVFQSVRRNAVRLLSVPLGAFLIVFVEKTIQINYIDMSNAPLTSASQLIPFLVALFSAASLIWASARRVRASVRRRNIRRGADNLRVVAEGVRNSRKT